jgi:hypothetical protein
MSEWKVRLRSQVWTLVWRPVTLTEVIVVLHSPPRHMLGLLPSASFPIHNSHIIWCYITYAGEKARLHRARIIFVYRQLFPMFWSEDSTKLYSVWLKTVVYLLWTNASKSSSIWIFKYYYAVIHKEVTRKDLWANNLRQKVRMDQSGIFHLCT